MIDENNESVLVYPNPIQGEFKVEYELQQSQTVTIKVFSITGQLQDVLLKEFRSSGKQEETLQLNSGLPSRNYILSIEGEEGRKSVVVMKE